MSSDITRSVIEALRRRVENLDTRLTRALESEEALQAENESLKIEIDRLKFKLNGRKSIVRAIRRGPSLK